MSAGLLCLHCRKYIAQQPGGVVVAEPCRCAQPRPSWDGQTDASGDNSFVRGLRDAWQRALRGEY